VAWKLGKVDDPDGVEGEDEVEVGKGTVDRCSVINMPGEGLNGAYTPNDDALFRKTSYERASTEQAFLGVLQ
jgi:hypothetical protein